MLGTLSTPVVALKRILAEIFYIGWHFANVNKKVQVLINCAITYAKYSQIKKKKRARKEKFYARKKGNLTSEIKEGKWKTHTHIYAKFKTFVTKALQT